MSRFRTADPTTNPTTDPAAADPRPWDRPNPAPDPVPDSAPDSPADDAPTTDPNPTTDSAADDAGNDGRDGAGEVLVGELVDADHDGFPDSVYAPARPTGDGTGTGAGAELVPADSVPDVDEVDDRVEEGETTPLVPVDRAHRDRALSLPEVAARREAAKLPIVAPWLREQSQRKAVLSWALRYALHVVGYHLARAPLYVLRLLGRAPRGLGRVLRATVVWTWDREGAPLRKGASDSGDADTYIRLSHQRNDRVKHRLGVTGGVVLLGVLVCAVAWIVLPPVVTLAAMLAGVCVLGWIGTPGDKPVIGRAVVKQGLEKLTSDVVVAGLGAVGLAGINKAIATKEGISFPEPITRDGPGSRAVVDLPRGVTADEVIERRKKLASGLRRPLGCVWPEGDASIHEGRLVLFVGDEDMNKAKQPPWPLGKAGQVDLFAAQPFGTDQRGRWVMVTLMYACGVIGSIPRMGKTFALRLLLLIAGLDPRVELHTYDLKGTGDLDPLAPIAHRHRAGDDPEDIAYGLADMRALRTEMRRRTKVIRGLDRTICPDSKVTPELASKKRLGLHPIVIGVDECQVWFESGDGAEFEEICTDLVKRGPATGIILLLATQRPDSKSIPTGISANVVLRFCLKVMGQLENDMVLGTSQYKNGVRATTFAFGDKGIGYLVGEGTAAQIVKTVKCDGPTSEKIVARARANREQLGRLTGEAAGEAFDTSEHTGPTVDVLADVATVFTGADRLWSSDVLARLAELRPQLYQGWTAKALADALKPAGLAVRQVWGQDENGQQRNRNGYLADDVHAALANRPTD